MEDDVEVCTVLAMKERGDRYDFIMDFVSTLQIPNDLSNCKSIHEMNPIIYSFLNDDAIKAEKKNVCRVAVESKINRNLEIKLLPRELLNTACADRNVICILNKTEWKSQPLLKETKASFSINKRGTGS